MSAAESYQFYGDTIDVVYYSTTGYKHATLNKSVNNYVYSRPSGDTEANLFSDAPAWVTSTNLQWVVYGASLSDYSLDPTYLGVSIEPNVHFSDCNALRFACAGYLANTTVSSQAYDGSFIRVSGQSELIYSNSSYTVNNVFPYWKIDRGNGAFRVLPVWCDYTSDTLANVSLLQVGLNGVRLDNTRLNIYLSCPLVNDTAYGGTGVVTGTVAPSTGTDINVNVDVDLHETNGLLSGIIDAVDGLIDGLIGLFVPSEEDLEDWCDDMDDLLHDHLGGMYEAVELIDDTYDGYGSVTAVNSFHVDACNIPLAGSTLTLGNWDVPLKTEALPPAFYDALAYIIDFLAVAAFVNMLRRKLEIILNPDSEVVETDG